MLSATRIRLSPTKAQAEKLVFHFGCARWVWNNALALSQESYHATGKGLGYHALALRLPRLKAEYEWLKDADSQALQQSLQNLSQAFDSFFRKRKRYPRFKSKHGRQSFQYPQRVKIDGSRIYLPKVGWVHCIMHREAFGTIKTVTVSRNACGQYHASILTENGIQIPEVAIDGNRIGVDVGLAHLAITSDGIKFDNPRHLNRATKNLKRKQRSLSRKKKGSKGRELARRLVARAHQRVTDARKDYLHKLSRRIIDENQVISVETLNVKGMMKLSALSRAISDASWRTLVNFMEYKAQRSGKAFVKIDRWFPSSKLCSICGSICDKMPLDVRSWSCTHCGSSHDRDVNAARNIRDEGLRILAGGTPATASGGRVSRGRRSNLSDTQRPMKLEASVFRQEQFTRSLHNTRRNDV